MSEIYNRRIEHPMAWNADKVGGKEAFTYHMSAGERAALDELLDKTKDLPKLKLSRRNFDHPVINRMMEGVKREIMSGHGSVILAAFDLGTHSREDYERIYWGLGTHLGDGAYQSPKKDLIGYVQDTPRPTPRGYLSTQELRPHTDFHEILSLGSVRKAASGGVSGIASSLAIHNAILAERPDLLPALYRGFYYGMAESESKIPLSPTKVPVFSCVDGQVSCLNNGYFMHVAAQRMGVELPPDLTEALGYFYQVSTRDDILLQFMLEPGEMLFWHNFTQLHARTEFHNTPEQKRLLLRLWLNVPNGRHVVPEIRERAQQVYYGEVEAA